MVDRISHKLENGLCRQGGLPEGVVPDGFQYSRKAELPFSGEMLLHRAPVDGGIAWLQHG